MSTFAPDRTKPTTTTHRPVDVLPASQYLQERLQERRSRVIRPQRRARHTDIGVRPGRDDDIFLAEAEDSRRAAAAAAHGFHSSPLAAFNGRASTSDIGGSSSSHHGGSGRRRALGIRDLDSQLDKLSKQNFDLKLELDHRREQTEKLKEQLEAMRAQAERAEQLADEHAELLRINSQLVEELEKRDRAVEEAMDIICDLEDRVAELEERNGGNQTRPSTANADSGYAGTETQEPAPPSSPPGPPAPPRTPMINVRSPSLPPTTTASQALQGLVGAAPGPTPVRAKRQPLALSHQKPSTHALRSVYLASTRELNPVKSFHSLLSRQESRVDEDEEEVLNSPRLSVLSESSFPSLYNSPAKGMAMSPDRFPWEIAADEASPVPVAASSPVHPRAHLRQDSIKRVSQWISERDAAESTPSKSNHISAPLLADEAVVPDPPSPRPPQPPKHGHFSQRSHFLSLNDALTAVAATANPQHPASSPGPLHRSRSERQHPHSRGGNPSHNNNTNGKSSSSARPSRPTSFGGPIFGGEPLLPPTPDSASTRMLRASRSSITAADDRSLLDTTPAPVKSFVPLEPGVRTAPRQMRSSVELSTAYTSNLEYRSTSGGSRAEDGDGLVMRRDSSSEEEEGALGAVGQLGALAEFLPGSPPSDEDAFPDGQSILTGTPRRFFKQGSQQQQQQQQPKSPRSPKRYGMSPGAFASPPRNQQHQQQQQKPSRRRSSAEMNPYYHQAHQHYVNHHPHQSHTSQSWRSPQQQQPQQPQQSSSSAHRSAGSTSGPGLAITKPRLARVETSPPAVFVGSLSKLAAANPKSSLESVLTSPRSAHSGSSSAGARTVVDATSATSVPSSSASTTVSAPTATATNSAPQTSSTSTSTTPRPRDHSPELVRRTPLFPPRSNSVTNPILPPLGPSTNNPGGLNRSRASPSPARTLSQRTQSLFRRLSNSTGSDQQHQHLSAGGNTKRDANSTGSDKASLGSSSHTPASPSAATSRFDWENKSPPLLPTLTSTPSSAYAMPASSATSGARPRTRDGNNSHTGNNADGAPGGQSQQQQQHHLQGFGSLLSYTPRGPSSTPRPPSSRGRRGSAAAAAARMSLSRISQGEECGGGQSQQQQVPPTVPEKDGSAGAGNGKDAGAREAEGKDGSSGTDNDKNAPASSTESTTATNASTNAKSPALPAAAAAQTTTKERKMLFRRSGSQKISELSKLSSALAMTPTEESNGSNNSNNSNAKSGGGAAGTAPLSKRRSSMRDAVGRRPWR